MDIDALVMLLRIGVLIFVIFMGAFFAFLCMLLAAARWLSTAPLNAKHPWYVRLAYKLIGVHK